MGVRLSPARPRAPAKLDDLPPAARGPPLERARLASELSLDGPLGLVLGKPRVPSCPRPGLGGTDCDR